MKSLLWTTVLLILFLVSGSTAEMHASRMILCDFILGTFLAVTCGSIIKLKNKLTGYRLFSQNVFI